MGQGEGALSEIVRLVGRDSLTEDQKVVLEVARIVKEEFLQQDAFSDWDYTCPLHKNIGMMKTICTFFDAATKACLESDKESKVTWALIENPMQTVEQFQKKFGEQQEAIEKRFKTLMK